MNSIKIMRAMESKGWDITYVESPFALNLTSTDLKTFEECKTLLCKLTSPQKSITSFSVLLLGGDPYASIFQYIFHNRLSPLYGSIKEFNE